MKSENPRLSVTLLVGLALLQVLPADHFESKEELGDGGKQGHGAYVEAVLEPEP